MPIRQLLETPPSALDLFIFRVHEAAECGNWLDRDSERELCLSAIRYNPATDVLRFHFDMSPVHEELMDFAELNDEERRIRLLEQLNRVVQFAGVEGKWGLLMSVPLSVRAGADVDVDAARKAIAARSEVYLHVTYGSSVYTAARDVDGFTDLEITTRNVGTQ